MLKKPIILPEGYPFIIISLIVAALLWYFGMLYAAVIPFVFACYFCYFFRCPRRNAIIPPGEDTIVSPADGTVVDVSHGVEEEMYLGENAIKSRSSFLFLMCTVIVLPWKEPLNTNLIHKDGFFLLMKKKWGLKMNAVRLVSRESIGISSLY